MTQRSDLGKLLTLIGYSSEFPEISEARKFTTVVLSHSLQKKTTIPPPLSMHCIVGLNTDVPVTRKVGHRTTNESRNAVAHAELEPCTKVQI